MSVKWTHFLFLLRCTEIGTSIRDLYLLTIGLVLDMWTEKANDGVKYRWIANQSDFDKFYWYILEKWYNLLVEYLLIIIGRPVMESIVNKLGFFDFFNSIIVGMFTIIGCFCITLQFRWKISIKCFRYLIYKKEVNILFLVLCLFSLVITSYIVSFFSSDIIFPPNQRFSLNPLDLFELILFH